MNGGVGREEERGAALLAVLLLVAVMAVLAAQMLDRLSLSTRLAANAQAQGAAQRALGEGEARLLADFARARVRGSGQWAVPRGQIGWTLAPGGNCFNINALVQPQADGSLTQRPAGMAELRALMDSLGIDASVAAPLVAAMADWIDSDSQVSPGGAEDPAYLALAPSYRTAGRLLRDVGELRAVRGMTPALQARLAPWLCALPEPGSSPLALHSLKPGQGRLLVMFAPGVLPLAQAEQLIAGHGLASPAALPGLAQGEVGLEDRWLKARIVATVDAQDMVEELLIDAGRVPPRIAARAWGEAADR